jgi:HEAT repeat protein
METLLLGFGVAGTVVALLLAAWNSARRDGLPSSHGAASGWKSGEDSLLTTLQRGSGGHVARVDPYTRGEEESGIELTVTGLCPKVALWRVESRASFRDSGLLETGDPEFDAVMEASGPPDQVHALLNAETRKAIRELLVGSVRVGRLHMEGGELQMEVPTTGFAGAHPGLPQAARAMAELSRHLVTPEPVRQRLAANARHDPVAGVRLKNLFAIVRLLPGDPFALAELRAATNDHEPEIRLRAAVKLGPDGLGVLRALAVDSAVEDGCSARAIEALGARFSTGEAQALLDLACRDPHRQARRPASCRACIAVLARDRRGEATLLEALTLRNEDVAVAAALALGKLGSAAAVLPLKEAAEHHGRALADAARRAVAEIQERLTGSPGELSLAEGEAGHLSLSDDVEGRISLPDASSRPKSS